ncbi:MAG TPA: glycosyltransferase family A protein [Vicinamibacterales bacterium]|jgi:glycosyltransferase involved in cell wall biosynthesis|nr:glycosyltransferase family A protein [Vicinamibacterales bacterium]
MSRPRVSVIMPAFNTEPYIAAAIASAQAQTVRDIEVVVVDDGSRDGTLAAARHAAEGDPRVRVWTQTNAGPSAARNLAMAHATGDVFAFLDSDDEWMPGFLDYQLAALGRHPRASIVTANAINRGGVLDGRPYRALRPEDHALSLVEIIEREDSVCIHSLFSRAVYDAIGPMAEALRANEDYEFWLRAARGGFEFVQTFEPLAYYRRRPDSASVDERKMVTGILRVFAMARPLARTPEETLAVDAQIARFERELRQIERRAKMKALASKHAPRLLSLAIQARRAILRLTVARAGTGHV